MGNPAGRPTRVDELDGLRGFLALWVAASHIVCLGGGAGMTVPFHFNDAWQDFVFAGPAVDTFIILSGFAISFLLHARPQSYPEFMAGRFFRIVPVYLVCLALGTFVTLEFTPWLLDHASWRDSTYFAEDVRPFVAGEHQQLGAHLFWHLLLLHGVVPGALLFGSGLALLPPAWTISLEWQYYLVAPLVARIVRSNLGVLILILISLAALKFAHIWHNAAFLPGKLDLFLIGIGSYHLYAWSQTAGRTPTPLWTRFVIAAFGLALLSDFHSVALLIWIIVTGIHFVARKDLVAGWLAWPRKLLLRPGPQLLGRWSYPLYLIHWPLVVLMFCLVVNRFPSMGSGIAILIVFVVGLPLLVAAAAVLHYVIEGPAMRWGRRLTHRKAVPRVHPEPEKIL